MPFSISRFCDAIGRFARPGVRTRYENLAKIRNSDLGLSSSLPSLSFAPGGTNLSTTVVDLLLRGRRATSCQL
jgi:hypothetical protein